MGAIHIRGVSKSYPIYDRPADRLKELLSGNRRSYHRDFWALREVTLEIEKLALGRRRPCSDPGAQPKKKHRAGIL